MSGIPVTDANEDYVDTVTNMHRFLVPLGGTVALGGGLIFMFLLVRKRELIFRYMPLAYIVLIAAQLFCAFFMLLNPSTWMMSLQLTFTGLVGFYSFLDLRKEWILWYAFMSAFNLFSVAGRLSFLGYGSDLYSTLDGTTPQHVCASWFDKDYTASLCSGYISFLRFIAFALIYTSAAQAFIAYMMYKNLGEMPTQNQGNAQTYNFAAAKSGSSSSSYESIDPHGHRSDSEA